MLRGKIGARLYLWRRVSLEEQGSQLVPRAMGSNERIVRIVFGKENYYDVLCLCVYELLEKYI